MQNSYNNEQADSAGFWVRLAAYAIDSLVVFAALLIVRLIMGVISLVAGGTVFGETILFQYTLKDIVLYVLQVLYFILCTYYTGTTLGKKALNLRVVRSDGEEKPDLFSIVYRETVGRFLCSMTIGIGYIMAGLDGKKQGLHDILADTRVVYLKKIKVKTIIQPLQPGPGAPVVQPSSEEPVRRVEMPVEEPEMRPEPEAASELPKPPEEGIPDTIYRLAEEPPEEEKERNS